MNSAPIIQSEVSHSEKQISSIHTYIRNLERWYWWMYLQHGNKRMQMLENRLVDRVEEEAIVKKRMGQIERVTLRHIHSDQIRSVAQSCPTLCDPIDITIGKTDTSWRFLYGTGSLNPVLCDHLEGWGGVGGGGRRHVYTYDWFTMIHGRNQHNIVKQLASN